MDPMTEIEDLKRQLREKEELFQEVQQTSQQYEQDLEAEIQRLETDAKSHQNHAQSALKDLASMREKYERINGELNQMQEQVMNLTDERNNLKERVVELELQNETLEKSTRNEQASAKEWENRYNQLLENQALLESEMEQWRRMGEDLQRTKDELRDARHEISVLTDTPRMSVSDENTLVKNVATPSSNMTTSGRNNAVVIKSLVDNMILRVEALEDRLQHCRDLVRTDRI